MSNYWHECITEAFEDLKIAATEEQTQKMIEWVEGAHENYGAAHGYEEQLKNHVSDEAKELERVKKEYEADLELLLSRKGCRQCSRSGTVIGGDGRKVPCMVCGN